MFGQIKQVMEMQKRAKELQKQLESIKVEQTSSDQTLRAQVNGAQHVEKLEIGDRWLVPSMRANLEKELAALINKAFEEAQKKSATQASDLMKQLQGMKLPGF